MALTYCGEKWREANKDQFVPPVCNKCMFADQLKVFFVGGPNERDDYHLEEGEEFFFQCWGTMTLKVIEKGIKKDIPIKKGEVFMLPARVEHSPQRTANSYGSVIERTRANTEFDCVRYFKKDSTDRLYERWFHLTDVVKDLPPLIRAFKTSESNKDGEVHEDSFIIHAPYEPNEKVTLEAPINIFEWIAAHRNELKGTKKQLFGAPRYKTQVEMYGEGTHELQTGDKELILWNLQGNAHFFVDGEMIPFDKYKISRVSPKKKVTLTVVEDVIMTIAM